MILIPRPLAAGYFINFIRQLLALLKNIKNQLIDFDFQDFDVNIPAKENATKFIENFTEIYKILGKNQFKLPIICLLDEVERILPSPHDSKSRVEEFNSFFGSLRQLSQNQKYLSLLVADVNPDFNRVNIWAQEGVASNPVFQFFTEEFIPAFPLEDTKNMLESIGNLMGVKFEEKVYHIVHEYSGGHPFISRQIASILNKKVAVNHRNDKRIISEEIARTWIARILKSSETLNNYLEDSVWRDLEKRNLKVAQTILKLLSCNPDRNISDLEICELMSNDFTENECNSSLLWLSSLELIRSEESQDSVFYYLNIELLSAWIKTILEKEEKVKWQLK